MVSTGQLISSLVVKLLLLGGQCVSLKLNVLSVSIHHSILHYHYLAREMLIGFDKL